MWFGVVPGGLLRVVPCGAVCLRRDGMKEARRLFPLLSVDSVVRLFALELGSDEPDLALLSIVLGYVEHQLTVAVAARATAAATATAAAPPPGEAVEEERGEEEAACSFPPVPWQPVEALRCRFVSHVLGTVDLTQFRRGAGGGTGRELVNKVSDVVWGTLHRSYNKDRAHIHSLYSYLTVGRRQLLFSHRVPVTSQRRSRQARYTSREVAKAREGGRVSGMGAGVCVANVTQTTKWVWVTFEECVDGFGNDGFEKPVNFSGAKLDAFGVAFAVSAACQTSQE
ncbi:menin [Callorhinchus milii]|uniref:menin n=1 Tax=Callorhinchus milii TaxID=7868 RepID=UPI001C3FD399|nr:menin [Callorhinchus milii]